MTRKDDLIHILKRYGFEVTEEGNNELCLVPTMGAGVGGDTISIGGKTVNVANYGYCVEGMHLKELHLKPKK